MKVFVEIDYKNAKIENISWEETSDLISVKQDVQYGSQDGIAFAIISFSLKSRGDVVILLHSFLKEVSIYYRDYYLDSKEAYISLVDSGTDNLSMKLDYIEITALIDKDRNFASITFNIS